ncbi:MAG: transglutaminase family protein [Planctomycetota bacterium]
MDPLSPPVHCRPEAYELFHAQLADLESTTGLLRAAVAISLHELPDADVDDVEREIARLAVTIRDRAKSGRPKALLAHLHSLLFDELGFRGDTETFYRAENSYLPTVLRRRRGIPISLTLLYKCVGERVGLAVTGINAPAHFLAGVWEEGRRMIVDPFAGGRVLTSQEAFRKIEGILSRPVPRSESLLRNTTHRRWIARMLRNLEAIFKRAERVDDLRAMRELRGAL